MSIPAYVDIDRLCEELCISRKTAELWMAKGLLPQAKQPDGHKRLWKWAEVVKYIDGRNKPSTVEGIINATKVALSESH